MFAPLLDILPSPQQALWGELSATPKEFALYGGTAIALRLGHRYSVDFDFFSIAPFVPSDLQAHVPYLAGGVTRQSAANTLTMSIERGGLVLVSFFGGLHVGQVEPHEMVDGPRFEVASLVDLSGMKVSVVTQRAELKDYLDIHALLTQAKVPLPVMLSAGAIIYGDQFRPLIALKAISFHEDEALVDLPQAMRRDLVRAVRAVDPTNLPTLAAVRGWRPRR